MRMLLTLLVPCCLMSCTKAEIDQLFPANPKPGGAPAMNGAVTVTAENPGAGGTPCHLLSVVVTADQLDMALSPQLISGAQWSRVLSAEVLVGKTTIELRAACTVITTDAAGNTVTKTGYSVSEHAVTSQPQMLTITGPRSKQNLAGRVEWATPVPGVLPLDQ